MTAARRAVQQHFLKNPFRYVVAHYDANRAQRRSDAKRDRRTGKLLTRAGFNVPFLGSTRGFMPWNFSEEGQEPTDA